MRRGREGDILCAGQFVLAKTDIEVEVDTDMEPYALAFVSIVRLEGCYDGCYRANRE